MKFSPITWLMLTAIAAIAGLAYLDEERESRAAMSDFAQEQTTLARSLAAGLNGHIASAHQDALTVAQNHFAGRPVPPSIAERYLHVSIRRAADPAPSAPTQDDRAVRASYPVTDDTVVDLVIPLASLLADFKTTETPNRLLLLLRPPGSAGFHTTDGRRVTEPSIVAGLDEGQGFTRLLPDEAGYLGLPRRTAVVGLARLDGGVAGQWGVAAVASAERERDRERWARWRSILSVVAASGLVLSFGGMAMRNQRKELLLQHKLALADLSRQRDERLERAGRAATMGTLAVGVAHEISTPLGIIAGRAEQILSKANGDGRTADSLRIILEQTDRIHRVIRGLLGLARGDRPTAEPVDPAALIDGAVALVEHRFAKAEVRLTSDLAADLPIVHGDPRLLEHALVNLLLNACDACEADGTVRLEARATDDRREILFSVVDNGPGISVADAERVLEPFFSTKPSGKGTGLGLAIAQEIVASHRGSLALTPIAPHGTCARIRIPIAEETIHA